MLTPYPYQFKLIDDVRSAWQDGYKNVILCAPTGAGKTVIFSWIGHQVRTKSKSVLVLTDRVILVEQVRGYGMDAMTAQSAWSQGVDLSIFDLVICDEAHEGIFTKLLKRTPPRFLIGATATPVGAHLIDIYTTIVQSVTVPELQQIGRLARCVAWQRMAADGLRSARGEYTDKSQMTFFDKPVVYDGVVNDWFTRECGQRTIVYAVNIAHAERLAEQFGAVARCVHSKSDDDDIISAHKRGDFPVLINVGMLTKGYDDPEVCVIMVARATKSIALWLQMVGRGGRVAEGKTEFRVYDYGGNFARHGRWDAVIEWKLEPPKNKGKGVAPVRICECGAVLHASATRCEFCGHVFEKKGKIIGPSVLQRVANSDNMKLVSKMSVDELIACEKCGDLKAAFVWRVLSHDENKRREYQQKKRYSSGWLLRQKKEGKKKFRDVKKSVGIGV